MASGYDSLAVLERPEREVVQARVHPRAVDDAVAHLFEVVKDDTRLLKLTGQLHYVPRHLVVSIPADASLVPFGPVELLFFLTCWRPCRIVK